MATDKWTTAILTEIFDILDSDEHLQNAPVYEFMSKIGDGPFRILISTLLSLRTKDEVTGPATDRLFDGVDRPEDMLDLKLSEIEKKIYPVGFYRTKARRIHEISAILLEKYEGSVPKDLDLLTDLPGVGRKTANLVVSVAFGMPSVCVDVHVHRISNRWGFCMTKSPDDTEMYIREHVTQKLWERFNRPLVALGQTICKPRNPKCNFCPIRRHCEQIIS